jgi:hypothetical protein
MSTTLGSKVRFPRLQVPSSCKTDAFLSVGGKDMRARDVKEGDDELMTADEFEAYWEIKQKLDEIDGTV